MFDTGVHFHLVEGGKGQHGWNTELLRCKSGIPPHPSRHSWITDDRKDARSVPALRVRRFRGTGTSWHVKGTLNAAQGVNCIRSSVTSPPEVQGGAAP